jgi:hypothetical protein
MPCRLMEARDEGECDAMICVCLRAVGAPQRTMNMMATVPTVTPINVMTTPNTAASKDECFR